jgi:Kef-type K+ transport system membrane component KefB
LLGAIVLLGAAFFVGVGGLFLFGMDRSALPDPTGALLLTLFMILLGFGMGYVGLRLLGMREHTDHLMSSRGARIASYVIATLSILMFIASAFSSNLELATAAVFAALMAYWLHTSANRIARSGQG